MLEENKNLKCGCFPRAEMYTHTRARARSEKYNFHMNAKAARDWSWPTRVSVVRFFFRKRTIKFLSKNVLQSLSMQSVPARARFITVVGMFFFFILPWLAFQTFVLLPMLFCVAFPWLAAEVTMFTANSQKLLFGRETIYSNLNRYIFTYINLLFFRYVIIFSLPARLQSLKLKCMCCSYTVHIRQFVNRKRKFHHWNYKWPT